MVEFPFDAFRAALKPRERKLVDSLDTPEKVQEYLAGNVRYNQEPDGATARGPIPVLRTRVAHCFEGAIFAAALLWYHGRPPTLVLLEAPQDFDHNLIIYERDGKVGCVSQSRHKVLLGKPAIYASTRDLALAYYPDYTSDWSHDPNDYTLRGFSEPIDLRKYGAGWVVADEVWDIYNTFVIGVRFEMLFPTSEAERFYAYPEEHLLE
jgi:hypothetical protein